jgi:hypothetical protein
MRSAFPLLLLLLAGLAGARADTVQNGPAHRQRFAELKVNIYRDRQAPAYRSAFGAAAETALKQGCGATPNGAAPYADIFFFRTPVALGLSDAAKKELTAAMASEDGPTALGLTEALRQDPNPTARFAAGITALLVWGNSGHPFQAKEAQDIFDAMAQDAEAVPPGAKADYYYLRSLASLEAGNSQQALGYAADAVSAEPQFFNAHVIRLALLVDKAEQGTLAGGSCKVDAQLSEALAAIVAFSPCALQAAHLARYLRSRQKAPDEHVSLLLTELFLSTISRQKSAFDAKVKALTQLAEQRPSCRQPIANAISDLVRQF